MPPSMLDADTLFVIAAEQEYGPELRRRIEPLICGVGVVEAGIATTLALRDRSAAGRLPRLVVSLGSAGSRRCRTGSLWQVSSVSWRDMDASKLGFPVGVTPFAGLPAAIPLPTPFDGIPAATLATGSSVLDGEDYESVDADLVDMETFAVVRACQRFAIPVVGLRGVSDGAGKLDGLHSWTALLGVIDGLLAQAVDQVPTIVASIPAQPFGAEQHGRPPNLPKAETGA